MKTLTVLFLSLSLGALSACQPASREAATTSTTGPDTAEARAAYDELFAKDPSLHTSSDCSAGGSCATAFCDGAVQMKVCPRSQCEDGEVDCVERHSTSSGGWSIERIFCAPDTDNACMILEE